MKKILFSLIFLIGLGIGAWVFASTAAVPGPGHSVVISYTADGTPPFSQQWYFKPAPTPGSTAQPVAAPIAGATGPTYTIVNAVPANAGDYYVTVTNPAGSATSDLATVSFLIGPGNIITGVKVVVNGVATVYLFPS